MISYTRLFVSLVGLIWLLTACGPAGNLPTTTPESIDNTTPEVSKSPESEAAGNDEESAATTPAAAEATPSNTSISDEEARELLDAMLNGSLLGAQEAIDRVVAAEDKRFVAALIELWRGAQIGFVQNVPPSRYIEAMESLSGQTFGADWVGWIEWYGGTDLEPPPGFTTWKGQMLAAIDPGFADFLKDEYPSRIRVEEIMWGGVRLDGIPALDNPALLTADKATYLTADDAVFGLFINGEARAYPLRIVDWHEMANDVIGGVPVSLAYCTLCGAAVAYDGRASDGNTYTFGSSGFLFRSNKLMYDRQTRTLWNQLTGEPVLGELVDADVTLEILPIVLTTWSEWQNQHPDTLVVDVETGFPRDYTTGTAYADYFAAPDTMFPVWQRSDLLDTKDQIYALRVNGLPKAYPIGALIAERVVNDEVAGIAVVVVAAGEVVEVTGTSRRTGNTWTYSTGAEVRAYERAGETFAPGPDDDVMLDSEGREWQVTEDALVGPGGETLPRLGGHLAYWFGWYAFFPETLVYGISESE